MRPRVPGMRGSPCRSPLRRGGDGVDHLHDAVQRRVGADGHVGAAEVVVDGAHQPHDVQPPVRLRHLLADLPCSPDSPQHRALSSGALPTSRPRGPPFRPPRPHAPSRSSSSSSPPHSARKISAPVRLPSPPMTHRLVMPCSTRLRAARRRPSRVVKALQRALPMTVPPCRGCGEGHTGHGRGGGDGPRLLWRVRVRVRGAGRGLPAG